jgi:hypothetical protein
MHISLRENLSIALPVACAAAAIAISGCGGGDSSTTASSTPVSGASGASSATPLSQDDFVSQANAICADVNTQLAAVPQPNNDTASIAKYMTASLAIFKPAYATLAAIKPPADLQPQFDAYLAKTEKAITITESLIAVATAGDSARLQTMFDELQGQNNDAEATALGLTECSKSTTPQG